MNLYTIETVGSVVEYHGVDYYFNADTDTWHFRAARGSDCELVIKDAHLESFQVESVHEVAADPVE